METTEDRIAYALGELAFDGYNRSTGGLTWDGKPVPTWATIQLSKPGVCRAWACAALAMRERIDAGERNLLVIGRAGFDAYNQSTGGLTHKGDPIPPWEVIEVQTPRVTTAWAASARALAERLQTPSPA